MSKKKKVGNGTRKPIVDLASRCWGSDNEGKYELIRVDPEANGWLESARSTLPFDELGQPT